MRKIVFILSIICFIACDSYSQYYEDLGDNTGFNVEQFQAVLDTSAKHLIEVFPEEYQDSFRVYSVGFYLHSENFAGGYPQVFERIIDSVRVKSKYYLLIGRQSDESGLYKKFWTALNLPNEGEFSCIDIISDNLRNNIFEKVRNRINVSSYSLDAPSQLLVQPAKAGMAELQELVIKFVSCCDPGIRSPACSALIDEPIDMLEKLDELQFLFDLAFVVQDSDYVELPALTEAHQTRMPVNNLDIIVQFPEAGDIEIDLDALIDSTLDEQSADYLDRLGENITVSLHVFKYPRDNGLFDQRWSEFLSSQAHIAFFAVFINVDDEWGVFGYKYRINGGSAPNGNRQPTSSNLLEDELEGLQETIEEGGGACNDLLYAYADNAATKITDEWIAPFVHRLEGTWDYWKSYYEDRREARLRNLTNAEYRFGIYFSREFASISLKQEIDDCDLFCTWRAKSRAGMNLCREAIHAALDACGFLDIVGTPCDLLNGLMYLGEGNYTDAALSAAGAIPFGEVVKWGGKAWKAFPTSCSIGSQRSSSVNVCTLLAWDVVKGFYVWSGGRTKLYRLMSDSRLYPYYEYIVDGTVYKYIPGQHAAHHVIPWEWCNPNNGKQHPIVRLAAGRKWHPSDPLLNGFPAWKNMYKNGSYVPETFHTFHPSYNTYVKKRLDSILNDLDKGIITSADVTNKMNQLVADLRKEIVKAHNQGIDMQTYFDDL